jgi:hypothetical protein
MGLHYWVNITANTPCDELFPIFLLFNKGVLTGFGSTWIVGEPQPSPRFEHPGSSVISYFFQPETLPKCLVNPSLNISTEHMFFTTPYFDFC